MSGDSETIRQAIDRIYRDQGRRIFASLVRLLRDFDLAEEALHDAFAAATEAWARDGVPEQPRAWLVSTGRFRAIDALRRRHRLDDSRDDLLRLREHLAEANAARSDQEIEDDRLRLIFTCCHPAIDPSVRVALTLREVCGLTTEAIATAFLVPVSTMAQRIARGKQKIRVAGIPFEVPSGRELLERLEHALAVIYLVYSEGHAASTGAELRRCDLTDEAIRLGRLMVDLLPAPESLGLLGLMLLQESRAATRTDDRGNLILLEHQDRSRWDRSRIAEGLALIERSLSTRRFGSYTLQGAIAAEHARAETFEVTDWRRIVAIYDALASLHPSPVIDLNRAVALAMRDGPTAGLEAIDAILDRGELTEFHRAHAARGEFLRRLERREEAIASFERALAGTRQEAERRFLAEQIERLRNEGG